MRFLIVLCFMAGAFANQSGYNYQPGSLGSGSSPVLTSDFNPGSNEGSFGSGSSPVANGIDPVDNLSGPISSGVGPVESGSVPSASGIDGGDSTNDAPSYSAPGGELNKEFFTFTANDDDFYDPAASNQVSESLKQGLRVVFIKGPENKGLEDAALALAKQASDQTTAIYVLNKQADIGDLANKLNAIRNDNNNKPEVHFVKYRTPEDAANAQQQIQSQYDSLGGTSQSHNGGVAPVINFASENPARSHGSLGGSASAPGPSYLPASIFRRFRL